MYFDSRKKDDLTLSHDTKSSPIAGQQLVATGQNFNNTCTTA